MDRLPLVFGIGIDIIPKDAIYVGRPTKWGNPYKIDDKRGNTREVVIKRYEHWLTSSSQLMSELVELRGKDLYCWCAPLPCHADVLLRLGNE